VLGQCDAAPEGPQTASEPANEAPKSAHWSMKEWCQWATLHRRHSLINQSSAGRAWRPKQAPGPSAERRASLRTAQSVAPHTVSSPMPQWEPPSQAKPTHRPLIHSFVPFRTLSITTGWRGWLRPHVRFHNAPPNSLR